MSAISRLTIQGYKSIRELNDFELRPLNILIGPNGAGKSNFVSFFRMLREMIDQKLQVFVRKNGGADAFLFMGPKVTKNIGCSLYIDSYRYDLGLAPTSDGGFVFVTECIVSVSRPPKVLCLPLGQDSGYAETALAAVSDFDLPGAEAVYSRIKSCVAYHFHDTSDTAAVKRRGSIRDNEYLRQDGANLAAFLLRLQKETPDSYKAIRDAVRLVAPFFDDFKLRPVDKDSDDVQLEWTQVNSDYPFHATQLSDGTLRFMCMAAALLQPDPPSTILLDEPELGMHPYGLTLLAGLLKRASERTQVIVSTQSAPLLNSFEPEDIIVAERKGDESVFNRLDRASIEEWLKDYSLGEIWQKNVIGGRPTHG